MVTMIAIQAQTLGARLRDRVQPSGQRGLDQDRIRHQVACLIAVVWWPLLGMVLAAAQYPSLSEEAVRVGYQYFVRYCSACHGVEGRGDGPAPRRSSHPRRISHALPGGVGDTSPWPKFAPTLTAALECRRMAGGPCRSGGSALRRWWGVAHSARPSPAAISSSWWNTSKLFSTNTKSDK